MNMSKSKTDLESSKKEAMVSWVQQMLSQSSLGDFTLKELLGELLSNLAGTERKLFLEQHTDDKSNGYYQRGLSVGSIPLNVSVPRVRSGEFRPAILPEKHRRGYSEENQSLLLSLLTSSRSITSAKVALSQMGIPLCESDMTTVVTELLEDFKLRNQRPLDMDLLVLWIDGKYVEVRDGNSLKVFTIYTAIGMNRSGHKQIIACLSEEGRESLDGWKKLYRNLLDRGLRRVLLIVQDDFSGLSPITESLFPKSHIQLCTVHMLRNAKSHLSKSDATDFIGQFRAIANAWSIEQASSDFDKLCHSFKDPYPTFIEALLRKKSKYLTFLNFPAPLRKSFATTNPIEIVNRQFEKIRLNNSGYFQSADDLFVKLNLSVRYLEQGQWASVSGHVGTVLDQLHSLFYKHFEL